MKFLNFFKTTLGITILILAVIAIIVIYLNWDAIKAWWSSDSDSGQDLTQYNNCKASYAAMTDADLRAALTRDMGLDQGALANSTRDQLLADAESVCRIKFYPPSPEDQRIQIPGSLKEKCKENEPCNCLDIDGNIIGTGKKFISQRGYCGCKCESA